LRRQFGGLFSVALSVASPRLAVSQPAARWSSDFPPQLALRREGLLDVLKRAGIAVLWRDNNSGCKGVCDRVTYEDLSNLQVPGLCRDGECYDEILLHDLQAQLDKLDRDAVVVLHMKGSHGPAYFKRYPPAFEFFTPVCNSNELDRCARQDIVNAYDNTLRYTDHVLSLTIDLLRRNDRRFDSAMLYVSDHGESLGENGLYLHGIPYALAPREQIHVEYFTPKQEVDKKAGGFVVELARSGQEFVIPEGKSILQVLLDAGVDVDYSCELGICGACEQRVISGTPEHRDAILTEEEQASNTKVMICCAGCKSERLVLDL